MSFESHTNFIKILIIIIIINASIIVINNLLINKQNKLKNIIKQMEGIKI